MNNYVDFLNRIKEAVNPQFFDDGGLETVRMVGMSSFIVILFGMVVIYFTGEFCKTTKWLDRFHMVLVAMVVVSIFTLLFSLAIGLGYQVKEKELLHESKLDISNYVEALNDSEYSKLEKSVKLYSDELTTNDVMVKKINQYLKETIGK